MKLSLNHIKMIEANYFLSRHYKQAYNHLLEIKLTDVNNLEVKTVAGFINYKVNQL